MRRRPTSTFNISFIDAILCGFGAAVLLFLTVNAQSLAKRNERTLDLQGEVARLEEALLQGQRDRVAVRNALQETQQEVGRYQGLADRITQDIAAKRVQLAELEKGTLATQADVERLKADIRSAEEGVKRLEAGATTSKVPGDRLREFAGEGDRQYLTDLKMGGQRILILVDASASMLGASIVAVLRQRNLPDAPKVRARKWQRAINTADWLTTLLPVASHFQLYVFNESAVPVIANSDGRWLAAGDPQNLNAALDGLRRVIPGGGTSLHHAFAVVKRMQPHPDNIFLLTDSLPTQGQAKGSKTTVSAAERLRHYHNAVKELPSGIPVNVILFPLEGDPAAASAFWRLALATRGSFLNPAEDWP